MEEERILLKEVASGKVEVVFNGLFSTLQFNCECLDVLPICKAMCCRLRVGYSVTLLKEEVGHYDSKPHPQHPDLQILQDKKEDSSCVYLGADSHCSIHGKHPWACQTWHCSPEGKGPTVKYRDGGWMLNPMGMVQMMPDGSIIDVRSAVSCK